MKFDEKEMRYLTKEGMGLLLAACQKSKSNDLYKVVQVCLRTGARWGQATHVLRHTFASHYMMNGGDILKLQKLLGHSTVVMTMRYAHLAPNALDDVLGKHALSCV